MLQDKLLGQVRRFVSIFCKLLSLMVAFNNNSQSYLKFDHAIKIESRAEAVYCLPLFALLRWAVRRIQCTLDWMSVLVHMGARLCVLLNKLLSV